MNAPLQSSLPKPKLREIVFLLLYSIDFGADSSKSLHKFISDELKVSVRHIRDCEEQLAEVLEHVPDIDGIIEGVSNEYQINRIPKVELNILRLAIFEMQQDEKVPPKVAMSEAIRLAKKFGNNECYRFVNALLHSIYQGSAALA